MWRRDLDGTQLLYRWQYQNRWYSQCLATTATIDGHLEYSLADERSFRELSYKWSIAWDRKVMLNL